MEDFPIGQLVMLGYDRPRLDDAFRDRLERHAVGGVMLRGDALGDPEEVGRLSADIQAAADRIEGPAQGLPFLVAVDQEGGRVQAWGPPHREPLPAAAEVGRDYEATGELIEAKLLAMRIGRELLEVGINLDFAPVLDVHTCEHNPIIGERSFSSRPEAVAALGGAFVEGLHAAGVLACGKHFPGHGDTELDSHLALPTVAHDDARLEAVELVPFRTAIANGLEMIMTAHVLYPAWDAERPATVSRAIVEGVLRGRLGFDGVVVTDDLSMAGVRECHDFVEAGVLALDAGCDLLLACREEERHDELLDGLAAAHRDGRLDTERLRRSLGRVVALKDAWLMGD